VFFVDIVAVVYCVYSASIAAKLRIKNELYWFSKMILLIPPILNVSPHSIYHLSLNDSSHFTHLKCFFSFHLSIF
jgi:hypothetical protein